MNKQLLFWSTVSFMLGASIWAVVIPGISGGEGAARNTGLSLHNWGISSDSIPNVGTRHHMVPQYLPIPDQLSYCGEEVDLSASDTRERFERELYIFANLNYQIMFYLKRAPRMFPYLEEQLRVNGLPDDLKYLAVIESDLIPVLVSARGARGIWQFMPETAQEYGMRVNDVIDERLHLDKSTQAAFKYLKNAYEKTGSWTMASAAYNMGLTRAMTHIRQQYTSDYYRMHMNQESARYVFKILAVKTIMEHPELYGYYVDESETYRNSDVKTVAVNAEIKDLPKWAIDNGTTYYDLRRVNPWIVGMSLPPGNYQIQVPVD